VYSPSPLPCVVGNSLHRAGPLPPRGEGMRREIFTPPTYIDTKKRGKRNQWMKKI